MVLLGLALVSILAGEWDAVGCTVAMSGAPLAASILRNSSTDLSFFCSEGVGKPGAGFGGLLPAAGARSG